MKNKNKVLVKILGQEYTIVSDEPREYMQRVSNYVDDKMNEIYLRNKKLSTAMVAVLTALNIADDYFKLKDSFENIKETREKPLNELQETKEQLAIASSEINRINAEYEKLQYEYEKLKEESEAFLQEFNNIKDEINRLNYELKIRDNKLKKAEKINTELKNKLVQSEVKVVQTKKELQGYIELVDNLTSK